MVMKMNGFILAIHLGLQPILIAITYGIQYIIRIVRAFDILIVRHNSQQNNYNTIITTFDYALNDKLNLPISL